MSERGQGVIVEGLERTFIKGAIRIEVLRELSITLEPAARMAILGPSGSGKSTFLQILGTLDRPTKGRVLLDGVDVFSLGQRSLDLLRNEKIGFVFQFHHLLPDQDALGNVAMPLIIGGMIPEEARAVAAERLTRVGLGARLRHLPGELSGGEQQRVAIARALVKRPSLLLADEPTGNLDPRTAGQVMELLLELNQEQGSTLVVVTHSEELAARFPRRMVMREGRLEDQP